MDQSTLMGFGNTERMDERKLTERVYRADVGGVKRKGRPRRRWRDGFGEFAKRRGFNF